MDAAGDGRRRRSCSRAAGTRAKAPQGPAPPPVVVDTAVRRTVPGRAARHRQRRVGRERRGALAGRRADPEGAHRGRRRRRSRARSCSRSIPRRSRSRSAEREAQLARDKALLEKAEDDARRATGSWSEKEYVTREQIRGGDLDRRRRSRRRSSPTRRPSRTRRCPCRTARSRRRSPAARAASTCGRATWSRSTTIRRS